MTLIKKAIVFLLLSFALFISFAIYKWGIWGTQYRLQQLPSYMVEFCWTKPTIAWETSAPDQEGIDPVQLDRLGSELLKKHTDALLVIRHNKIVYEKYAENYSANKRHFLASAAKPIVGGMVLAGLLDEGKIKLNDHAAQFITQWKDDPLKSKITIQHLASHSSGMIDIPFDIKQTLPWKKEYVKNTAVRFDMALNRVPVVREPGTFYSYSGVGYYALAYSFASILRETPYNNVKVFFKKKITRPLGIPDSAWTISYSESYHQNGLTLYACGSGASFTARALAKIGQLIIDKGLQGDKQIISPAVVEKLFARPIYKNKPLESPLPFCIGWHLNINGFFPSLHRDAILVNGGGNQIILLIPSMDIVLVRLGRRMSDTKGDPLITINNNLITPLLAAVIKPKQS